MARPADQSDTIAEITWKGTAREADRLYPFLLHRAVNRKPYRRQAIDQDRVQKLRDVVHETPGADMIWMDREDVKKPLRKIIFDADRILFEDPRLHRDLFRWVRFEQPPRTDDGLGLDVLELSQLQTSLPSKSKARME